MNLTLKTYRSSVMTRFNQPSSVYKLQRKIMNPTLYSYALSLVILAFTIGGVAVGCYAIIKDALTMTHRWMGAGLGAFFSCCAIFALIFAK